MTTSKLPLCIALVLLAGSTAIAQDWSLEGRPQRRFPGGLELQPVARNARFAPQVGARIIDASATIGDDGEHHAELFDAEVLLADCGYSCPPAWTTEVEAFYLNREGDDRFTASSASFLNDFDYELGVRATLRRHYDCLEGWDLTYTGGFDWSEINQQTGTGLNALFTATGGIDLSAFNNATLHSQLLRSRLHSLELNRKWYGWDVFAVGLGLRYLNVEEDYLFGTVDAMANTGSFNIETNNNAGGAQLLLELKVPIGRWTTQARFKGGLFANAADSNTTLTNAGTLQLANADDDIEFSSLIEIGYSLRYRVTPNISIQAGYEAWWLYGIAIAPDQVRSTITPLTGLNIDSNGDTWYHGGTAGVEVVY